MKIGCHISIRHGYAGAAKTAMHIGADAFQYFPKNPRSLAIKSFDRSDASACAQLCRDKGLVSVAHAPYPVNLAVEPGELRAATAEALKNDLDIADSCGSAGVVVHFGKFKGKDPLQGYKNIIQCLNEVLGGYKGNARLLLENQAGEGGTMGTTLEELVRIRSLSDYPERIGFCFDTCHAFASGLWDGAEPDRLEEAGMRLGYAEHLYALHLNDSAFPFGSGRDRHANIGKGYIGEEGFYKLLRSFMFATVPGILETGPGPDGTHKDEIRQVRRLAGLTAAEGAST